MPERNKMRTSVFPVFVRAFGFQVLSLEYGYSIQHSFER